MNSNDIKSILEDIKNNKVSIDEALIKLRDFPYKDLDFVKLDYHRPLRKGFGEVIYCKSKTLLQIETIAKELKKTGKKGILYTKVDEEKAQMLQLIDDEFVYNKEACMVYTALENVNNKKPILILTGGTSDIPIAEEAYCTALTMGYNAEKYYDVGVAGIHRLFAIYDKLQNAGVIITIAGMEGALASVVAGLVSVPVIAVPTSIGYGANFQGLAPLLSMLNSCSPGIAVVNIDNGFGAGYMAAIILNKD
jgi:pyridinium-3,5-biscarboxylic acid mononucleotide synthase